MEKALELEDQLKRKEQSIMIQECIDRERLDLLPDTVPFFLLVVNGDWEDE